MNKPQNFELEIFAPNVSTNPDATPKFEFSIYWGSDGIPVLEVRTGEMEGALDPAPKWRSYLNDALIHYPGKEEYGE